MHPVRTSIIRRHSLAFCVVVLLLTQSPLALADEIVSRLPAFSRGFDPDRDPFEDGRDALVLARRTDRLVMIEVGGDWCRWCHVLDRFLQANNAVYDRLHENFVLLKVNTSEANDNAEFLSGLPDTNGYPHVFISRGDGSLIGSTDITRLVVDGRYDAQRFLTFLDHWLELKTASRLTANP